MSMRKIVCGLAAAAAAGAIAQEQGGASAERGGSARFGNWRLTVGPAMNVGVKAKLRARPAAIAGHMPAFARPTGISSEEAAANAAQGKYDNGAFINPDSSVELVGQTWNWWAPESAYDGSKLTFRNAYVDTSSAETAMGLGDKDDHVVPGVTAELSRNLFHDEERNWGLDISGLVSWYKRDKILKAGGERYSRTDTTDAGEYVTEYENGKDVYITDRSKNPTGGYGMGTYGGPGPLITPKAATKVPKVGHETTSGRVWAEGDYEELELALVARPYYDVSNWFRLYATVGVAASYMRFKYESTVSANGRSVSHRSHTYDDWDVYAVAGLGAMFSYERYSLGFDFLARLWADPLTFDTDSMRGSVERGDWTFRVWFGIEF